MRTALKIAVATGAVLAAWALVAPMLAAWLVVERPLEHADAIMVLSGSAAYKERTQKAAELYSAGIASEIYITDEGGRSGWSQSEKTNLTYLELARRELVAHGVGDDSIRVLPSTVAGTIDEAEAVAAASAQGEIRSLVIVTSPYHTRRALSTFERVLAAKGIEVGVIHGGDSVDANFWWLSARGWRNVGLEYVKMPVYWAFY